MVGKFGSYAELNRIHLFPILMKGAGRFAMAALVSFAVFFGLALCSTQVRRIVLPNESNVGGIGERLTELKSCSNKVDVVILGSSVAMNGIVPQQFNTDSSIAFSLASNGQYLGNSEILLRTSLETLEPKLVILDVAPFLWKSSYSAECALDWSIRTPIHSSPWSNAALSMSVHSGDAQALFVSTTFWLLRFFQTPYDPLIDPNQNYLGQGFSSSTRCQETGLKLHSFDAHDPPTPTAVDGALKHIENIQLMCNKSNVELVVVIPPHLQKLENHNDIKVALKRFSTIDGQDWTGSEESANFRDEHHLCRTGAEEYTKWLLPQIRQQAKSFR